MMQLSLWDTPPEEQPPVDLPVWEEQYHKQYTTPPPMLFKRTWWADGDSRPASLDRLALAVLGDLETFTFRINGGDTARKYFYRCVSTCIVDDKVIEVCELVSSLKAFFGGKDDVSSTSYEDDDVD